MKKNLLKTMLVTAGLFAGAVSVMADDITATLTHTAGTRYSSAASVANTVDGEQEYYNNDASSGWVGYAFAEFGVEIPEGDVVKSATLTWTATSSAKSKSRDNKLYYLNAGTSLDYDAIAATQSRYDFSSSRTYINNTASSKKEAHTTDVTAAVKAITTAGQKFVVFQWTGNAEGGWLEGKGSTDAPVLTIETASAADMTKYTVKFVDAEGNELKTAVSYDVLIGEKATASDADMANFYPNEETKYIYVSGNQEIETVKDSASNVITLVFRKAEAWDYRLDAVDAEGNTLKEGILKGTDFEGETFNVAYSYALNFDGTLYTAGKLSSDKKGYYFSLTLSENNIVKPITYTASETTDVVYFSEAEDIEGLTKTTNANTAIRSSFGGSAYAADADVEFTTLPAGKYKLTTVICDATKNAGSVWNFKAGNDTIFTFKASTVNWSSGTSDEFTLKGDTKIALCKGGNANQGVDFIYIQRTGDYVAPEVVITKLADLQSLEDGTDVTIKTTDAVFAICNNNTWPVFATMQDTTGAIKLSTDMTSTLTGVELTAGSKISGTLYGKYTVAEDGTPTLDIADNTEKSELDLNAGTVEVTPIVKTVAEAKQKSSLSMYVEIKNAKMWADEKDDMRFYIAQGTDTMQVYDKFWGLYDGFTAPDSIEYIKGVVAIYDSVVTIHPYGEDAVPVQAFEAENIAALAGADDDALVKLTLNNAKVTVVIEGRRGSTAYLEDESGALEFGEIVDLLELKAGMTLNGTLYALCSSDANGIVLMSDYTFTEKSEFSSEEGEAIPTATTIADVKKPSNANRFVSFKNASVKYDEENYVIYMIQGTDTLQLIDSFDALPTDDDNITVIPDSLVASEGILGYDSDEQIYYFVPTTVDVYEGDATKINGVAANASASKNAAVYSVSGVKVRKEGQSLNGLAKGLYIINGKKVVIK